MTTLLFGDDWVIIRSDHLEIGRFELLKIAGDHNVDISTVKAKVLAFLGKSPVKAKIVMNGEVVEEINVCKWDTG